MLRPEPEPCRCSDNTLHRGPRTPASTADRREELPKASRQRQLADFKKGATAYSAFSKHLLSTFHVFDALEIWQQTPETEVLSTPQAAFWKKGGETILQRTLIGRDDSLFITD